MMFQNRIRLAQMSFGVLAAGSTVLTAAPALAERAVKVECWGNCGGVNLGQICGSATPLAVACDDAADPGAGTSSGCGNGATCTPNGSLAASQPLSAYCKDGGDYDAVVTCSF